MMMPTALRLAIIAMGSAAAFSASAFELSSPDIPANSTISLKHVYNDFGCKGQNVSPALVWKNPPTETKSFAVTVYDPDAPTGSGWWHWVIFDIPAAVSELPANAGKPETDVAPKGSMQTATDYGTPGYGGPCPPPGDRPHRYIFTVFALKVDKLAVNPKASPAMVGFNLNQNALDKASFTATYGR